MHVAWCDVRVGDDVVFGIGGTMIEIIKSLRFSFAGEIAAVRIGGTDLDIAFFCLSIYRFFLERRLAIDQALLVDRHFQLA